MANSHKISRNPGIKRPYRKRLHERFKNSIALVLAIALLLPVLPMTALASMTDSGNDATVESFGEFESTITVENGTSYRDAAAELPDNLPAIATEQAEPYRDDVSIKWVSEPSYDANKPGKYAFTAQAAGGITDKAWPVYAVEILAQGKTPVDTDDEYKLQVAYGTELIDLKLPEKLATTITPEPVTYDTEIGVEWECEAYDPETPGEYVFTAAFAKGGWEYDGEMPTATVQAGEQTASPSPTVDKEQTTASPSPATEEEPIESPVIEEEEPIETEKSEDTDGAILITAFDPYPYSNPDDPDTHYIVVDQGTVKADLSLPQTLKATTQGGQQNAHTVDVTGWECVGTVGEAGTPAEGAYDPNTPGTYRFSPGLALAENESLADGLTPPTVDVVVSEDSGFQAMATTISGITYTSTRACP